MKNINQIVRTLFLFVALFTAASCTEDPIDGGGTLPPVPEGYVRASIATNVSENEQVKTRATDVEEKAYDEANVWVLMFNATSAADAAPTTIVQAPVKATKIGAKLYALLRATAQPVTVYVVAGLTASQNTYLGTSSNFTEGTTTYAAISTGAQLQTAAVTAAGIPIGGTSPVNYIPMCTDRISYPGGTTTLTEIAANFRRIAAKIDIDASVLDTDDFTLEGVTLANGAQKGFVLPQATLPANNGGTQQYTEKSTVASNKILAQVYLYENNGAGNPTKVIVKGKYKGGTSSYYRMDLHRETGANTGIYTPHDINRNKHYTVVISEIQNGGYATLSEALSNKPSNAKYTVTVTDPDSHDVVSNGEYYLGVSNSEYIVYAGNDQTDIIAFTLTHNAPSSVVTATLTASGTGLSFGTIAGTTGTAAVRTLTIRNSTEQKIDVKINLGSTFSNTTTGAIVVQIGNLKREVIVTRNNGLPFIASLVNDFAASSDIVMANVETAPDWIKLYKNSADNNGYSYLPNSEGGFIIKSVSNIENTTGTERRADIYFSRKNDKGRGKAHFVQAVLNKGAIDDDEMSLPANLIVPVGAFWRANQTGERLIRMTRPTGTPTQQAAVDGYWDATVLDYDGRWDANNGDGILIDKVMSADLNVGWRSGANEASVANGNDAGFDNTYKVTTATGTNYVYGEMSAADPVIYFRIGLQKPYTPTSAYPARYALVVLTYTYSDAGVKKSKLQRIFIRQGHDADYLIRPGDPDGSGNAVEGGRPNAKKFSPYNLSDPLRGNGGANVANHTSLPTMANQSSWMAGKTRMDNGRAVTINDWFTDYPSQAGYMFEWIGGGAGAAATRRAYHPTNPNSTITGWPRYWPVNTYWSSVSANVETCPQGYVGAGSVGTRNFRRPNDGSITGVSAGAIAGSEIRQSLFLNPPTGESTTARGNIIWGSYADGFSDRRLIHSSIIGIANSAFSSGSSTAYVGRLMYNKTTLASIFLPAAGYRLGDAGGFNATGPGFQVCLISSSIGNPTTNNNHFWAYLSEFQGAYFYMRFGTWDGYPIRCVTD